MKTPDRGRTLDEGPARPAALAAACHFSGPSQHERFACEPPALERYRANTVARRG
jgi:hypothetical protein